MRTEPVITVGGIGAAAAAILALLVSFGIPVSDDQQNAILGVVAVLAPLVVAYVARRYVTANSNVVERAEDGDVLAGEANTIPTGAIIRKLDESPAYQAQRAATPDDPLA